jgi:hypothetical protein
LGVLRLAGAATAAGATLLLLLLTSPRLPMVWDEGNAIHRAQGIQRWASRWQAGRNAALAGPLSKKAIDDDWSYTTRVEGHPALYGIVLALGNGLGRSWLAPLESWRLGPILLFAVAAGSMFYRLAADESLAAAIGGVAALLLLPRLFAHAHFASFDGPLTSCWLLTWAAFAPARSDWRWSPLFGLLLGMTLSAKGTGWLAPLPLLAVAALGRDRPGLRALAVGLPIALAVFFLLNPPLWHQPWTGFTAFLDLNVLRAAHERLNVTTCFFGRLYDARHPLPWYNTLFWTGATVPVGILALAVVGIGSVLGRRPANRAGLLLVAQWLVLLVARALPTAPPHDAERLILPSFVFLAALAGLGAAKVCGVGRASRVGRAERAPPEVEGPRSGLALAGERTGLVPGGARSARPTLPIGFAAVGLIYAGSATSLFWYAPQWLSYYNLLIGGLPGATALGMEPTYYWDGLDRSVLDWLQAHTGPAEKVEFATGAWENLELMRAWGTLRCECQWEAPGEYRWYVIQRRPSAWQPADRWLIEHARPTFTKTIRPHGFGPWRLDVPLVEVYSYQQYLEAVNAAVTVHRPGDWLIFRPVSHCIPPTAGGRKMCLSPCADGDMPLVDASRSAVAVRRVSGTTVKQNRSGISRNDSPELPAEC